MLNKKIVRISFCFLICVAMLFSACPIAFASTQYFQVNFNQPQLSGDDFYVEILLYNSSTGDYRVKVLYVVSSLVYTATDSVFNTNHLNVKLELNSDSLYAFSLDNGSETFYVCVAEFTDDNRVRYYDYPVNQEGNSQIFGNQHTDYGSGYKAVSYRVYGDVSEVVSNYSSGNSNTDFTIIYSQANSVNQSILQLINAVSVVAQIDQNIANKLDTVINGLNDVNGNVEQIYQELLDLFAICEDIYDKIGDYEKYINDVEDYLGQIDYNINEIFQCVQWIYSDTQDMVKLLRECSDKLQEIIDLLNTGQNEPTLKTPNDSVDSAFDEVGNMFDDVGDIGDQLEANKQQNQANLANAKSVISGFMDILPTEIIVALAFVAICLLVVKVIGR